MLMSQAAYARHRKERGLSGTTGAAVAKAIRVGRIQLRNGKIDPEEADQAWRDNTDVSRLPLADRFSDETIPDAEDVFEAIAAQLPRLPEILKAAGAPIEMAMFAFHAVIAMLIGGKIGDLEIAVYGLAGGPLTRAMDMAAMARRLGTTKSKLLAFDDSPELEAWFDALSDHFDGGVKKWPKPLAAMRPAKA